MKQQLLIFFSLACLVSNAQTADEIIQQYATVMGGLENINKMQTLKKTGSMISQGVELQMTVQVINHKAMRTDIEAMGKKLIVSYKDGKAWTINPFAGDTTASDVTGPELADLKSQCLVASQLMDYKARGHKVELSGKENINGTTAYRIKLVNSESGKANDYLIDSSTSLLIKLITKVSDHVDEMDMEEIFTDIREISGFKFSMVQTRTINGEIIRELKFSNVEVNVPIDEKIFEKQ